MNKLAKTGKWLHDTKIVIYGRSYLMLQKLVNYYYYYYYYFNRTKYRNITQKQVNKTTKQTEQCKAVKKKQLSSKLKMNVGIIRLDRTKLQQHNL